MKAVEQVAAQSSSQNAYAVAKVRSKEANAGSALSARGGLLNVLSRSARHRRLRMPPAPASARARLDAQREAFDARLAEGRQERGAIIDGYA